MQTQALLEALKCIRITHHTPGRLRLDIASKIRHIDGLAESDLEQIFNANGVKECKINKILGKLTLLYDAQIISPSTLEALLNASDESALKAAAAELGCEL